MALVFFEAVVVIVQARAEQEDPFVDDGDVEAEQLPEKNQSGSTKEAALQKESLSGKQSSKKQDDEFADLEEVDEEDRKLDAEIEKERKEFRDGFGDIDALTRFVKGEKGEPSFDYGAGGSEHKVKVGGSGADHMRTQMAQIKDEQSCPKQCREWIKTGKYVRCDLCHLLVSNVYDDLDARMEEDEVYAKVKKICDDERLCNKYEITNKTAHAKWSLRKEEDFRTVQEEDREEDEIKWQSNAMRVVCKSALKTYEEEMVNAFLEGRKKSTSTRGDIVRGICVDIKACKKKERSELENVLIERRAVIDEDEL